MKEYWRAATYLALFALAVALVGFFSLLSQMRDLRVRMAALERKASPSANPQSAPSSEKPVVRQEMDADTLRGMALQDCGRRLGVIAEELKLEAGVEMKLRDAFADEFSFYADGVVRAFEELRSKTSQSNVMNSPEFQKKLEEKILATDQKVAQILTVSQRWVYEKWRVAMRQEHYGLE